MLRNHRFLPLFLLICFALVPLAGCVDTLDDGPQIESVTITPNSLSQSSTGMTDEFFEVTILTSGFTTPIETATVKIQDVDGEGREGEPQGAPTINGDTVVISQIAKSWFGGLEPGQYNIEVTVENSVDSVRQANAATVTVTE